MRDTAVARQLFELHSVTIEPEDEHLDLTCFNAGPAAIPGQYLVKLRQSGDRDQERAFLAQYGLNLLARLPLPGKSLQEQVVLYVSGSVPTHDPRVSYAVQNTVYMRGGGRLRTSNAARLIEAITSAERRGLRIQASSWCAPRENRAIEDALRRAAHCMQIRPTLLHA